MTTPSSSTASKTPKISGYGGNWLATSLASRHESDQALPKDSRAELTTYLSEELYPLDASGNTDILAWWKVCSNKYFIALCIDLSSHRQMRGVFQFSAPWPVTTLQSKDHLFHLNGCSQRLGLQTQSGGGAFCLRTSELCKLLKVGTNMSVV